MLMTFGHSHYLILKKGVNKISYVYILELHSAFSPVAELSPSPTIPPIDKALCLICQKSRSVPFSKTMTVDKIERIVKSCQDHHKFKTGRYKQLYDRLKHRTLSEISDCKYHNECSRNLSRDEKYISRAQKPETTSKKTEVGSDRIPRSSMPLYDKEKCFFCQKDTSDPTHQITQDSKDNELKTAFRDSPVSLGVYRIRYERAVDATAGDVKYHSSCWRDIIFKRTKEFDLSQERGAGSSKELVSTNTSEAILPEADVEIENYHSISYPIYHVILTDIACGVVECIANNNILSMRDVVDVYDQRCEENGVIDDNTYASKRLRIKRYLKKQIPELDFVDSHNNIESQRIITNDMRGLLVHLATLQSRQRDNIGDDVRILKKASAILRETTLEFLKSTKLGFEGTVVNNEEDVPHLLSTFMKWILAGQRMLTDGVDADVSRSALTLSNSVIYKMKSDRQVKFNSQNKEEMKSRNMNPTKHHVGIGLAVHSLTRDERVLNLLSSYHECIKYTRVLEIETALANAVIMQMIENNNVYIPRNLQKGVMVTFHLDNINWQEDTHYGKGVTNAMNLAVFQPNLRDSELSPPLKLPQNMNTKKLLPNNLNELRYCAPPKKKSFRKTDACKSFSRDIVPFHEDTVTSRWLLAKSIEFIVSKDDNELEKQELPFRNDPMIPTWSGSNSLLGKSVSKEDLTNVYNTPLINGSANDYSAILTGITMANDITLYLRGCGSKSIISLDLDLYEKVYLLVNSREDLRNKYVLCLGELHSVFAYLRAIGTYIECSGLDESWIRANLFGENTCRQVLTCARMNRAIECHESTWIAITINILQTIAKNSNDITLAPSVLIKVLGELQTASHEKDHLKFKESFSKFVNCIHDLNIDALLEDFKANKEGNSMFRFISCYLEMLSYLFDFVYASRARNWNLHLSSLQKMMPGIIMMDRIKYRRWIPVYLADMVALKETDPEVWNYFEEGNFSVQKTEMPYVAIGRDHAGEQENKVLKVQGGLQGITRQENARTRYFLIAPILKEYVNDMKKMGGSISKESILHHHLNYRKQSLQNKDVSSLVDVFNEIGLCEGERNDKQMSNLVSGRIFPNNCEHLLDITKDGNKLYDEFISERLQENSSVDIFSPIKKVNAPIFKKSGKAKQLNLNGKIHELKDCIELFSKCLIVSSKRDIDMPRIVGEFELSSITRSFMKPDGEYNPGGENKEELVHTICKVVPNSILTTTDEVTVSVIDAMQVVQKLYKPYNVNTFKDLAQVFIDEILNISSGCTTIIVAFDEYRELSLKAATRKKRTGKQVPVQYVVNDSTIIQKLTMKQLLSHTNTKRDLSKYFQNELEEYLKKQARFRYVVAVNGKTVASGIDGFLENSHEEADSLMVHCLSHLPHIEDTILVHSNDTDVFVLFVSLLRNIPCKKIIMKWSRDMLIDLTQINGELKTRALGLIGLHAFTGCDIVEKFSGKGKKTWVKAFLKADKNIIEALASYPYDLSTNFENELERFVSNVYVPKKNISSVKEARWIRFKTNSSNISLLPPTQGALHQHILRSYWQAKVWINAIDSHPSNLDPKEYGWYVSEGEYDRLMTENPMAPPKILELTSCACKKSRCSSTSRGGSNCSCRALSDVCAGLCQCENCENCDVYVEQPAEDEDEQLDTHEDS